MPKIALLHRIRLRRKAAGGTTDWIGLRNANAGICVGSEGPRNKPRNARPISHWAQGLLHPSQHDQAIAREAPSLPAADTATVGSIIQGAITPQASPGLQTGAPIAPPTQNDASVVTANSREGKAADAFQERPVQETSASSQTDAQTAGANDAEVASPDAAPRIVAHAASTDDAASVPDDYIERVVRSRKQAANEQPPIFFFVIAVALAVIGIAIHLARRLRFRV